MKQVCFTFLSDGGVCVKIDQMDGKYIKCLTRRETQEGLLIREVGLKSVGWGGWNIWLWVKKRLEPYD